MSYNDGGDGSGYGGYGRQDPSEYGGGGGRGQDNYYDQSQSYDDNDSRRQQQNYGGGGGGGGGEGGGGFGARPEGNTLDFQPGGSYQRPGSNVNYQGYQDNDDDDNMSGAMRHAQKHSQSHGGGSGGEEESIFSTALGFLGGNKHRIANGDLDEGGAVQAHQAMYGGGGGGGGGQQHGSDTIGAGAAMQALKMFTGGSSGGGGGGGGSGGLGTGGKNEFIGMAMGQASKLFDQQSANGNVAQGTDKQSAVTKAGEMALKMYLKSQMGGGGGGGGGGLASMAAKFM